MSKRLYICKLILALLMATEMTAQGTPPELWFDKAAKEFVKDERLNALRTLDMALREHPGDARLLKLAEELLKDQDQEEQEQQKQQDDQQKKEDQQRQDEQNQQGKQDAQDEKNNEERRKDEPGKGDQQEQRREPPPQEQLAPQDAKRILDALEQQEKDVQEKARVRQRPAVRKPIDKDW